MVFKSTRILIVEDEPAHVEAIRRSLESLEHVELRVMGSLREFQEHADLWKPAIVLMDIHLPDGRAMDILADPGHARPYPVIVMTSSGSEQTAVEALKLGALDYLVKSPETFGSLPRILERLLEEWRRKHESMRMHRELMASEAKFRSLAESSRDFITRYDPQDRYTYLNPAAMALLGPEASAMLGKTHLECGFPEPLARFLADKVRQVFQSGEPLETEFEYSSAKGPRTHEWRLTPEFAPEGAVYSVMGVSRDITERRKSEEEKLRLEAQLQQSQKMESLGSLAGGVAHDMNNVLGAILGLASANLAIHPRNSPTYQAFETISKAAIRGGKLVKSLLSLAHQRPGEVRPLDLNTLLREQARLLERTTFSKVRLDMDLVPDLRPISGDASALTHAFMNLCVNAVDAIPDNGAITLRSRNLDDGRIEVQVIDTGCGMSKEVLARAMDPFFTTKPEGKGTGLGLSLVYTTMKAHQGQMAIRSEPGQGTCVSLRFPVCETVHQAPEPLDDSTPAHEPQGLTMLLVDDDELIQSSMKVLLEVMGHQVKTVSTGEEAITRVEAGLRPDVVILDMNMPGLGGAGTLPQLRILLPDVPILLATGRADQKALDLVEAHPGVTLLSKPFTLAELRGFLSSL
jgi:PAS domain S-box-containing protein